MVQIGLSLKQTLFRGWPLCTKWEQRKLGHPAALEVRSGEWVQMNGLHSLTLFCGKSDFTSWQPTQQCYFLAGHWIPLPRSQHWCVGTVINQHSFFLFFLIFKCIKLGFHHAMSVEVHYILCSYTPCYLFPPTSPLPLFLYSLVSHVLQSDCRS